MFAAVSAITIELFIFLMLVRLYILYPASKHDDNRYKNYLAKAAAVEWIAIKKPNKTSRHEEEEIASDY